VKRILLTLLILVFTHIAIGQGINFQGVARSANGTILSSQKISLKLSIITGVSTNTPDYMETRSVETNAQGIFSIVIGDIGAITTIGAYANIDWKNNIKFLKVEMDPNNGTNFISMGTTQLQYVPFSYYANGVDAANVAGVLPVKSGGTGVASISDLKVALAIDKVNNTTDIEKPISALTQAALDSKLSKSDTASLSNRIDAKLNKLDTASLSNRINTLSSKIDNQASLFTTLNITQFKRDRLSNLNPGSIIWCTNCSSAGELQVYNGDAWKNIIGGDVAKATPELDSTKITNIKGHSFDASSFILYSYDDDRVYARRLDGGIIYGLSPNLTINTNIGRSYIGRTYNNFFNEINIIDPPKKDSFVLSATIINLTKNTKYYIRSYAINSIGTAYGTEKSFYTNNIGSAPYSPTFSESYLLPNKVAFFTSVRDKGGEEIIESGIEYATSSNYSNKTRVNIKNSNNEYIVNNLQPGQKYYIRSFAKNIIGETIQVDTSNFIAYDITSEQNKTSVQIGNQIWTALNLNVFNYRNGDPIPLVLDSAIWRNLTTGAYTYFNNDSINYGYLGKIYNWYAVMDSRGLAPSGWHLPTSTELNTLYSYLGGSNNAGKKLLNTSGNLFYDYRDSPIPYPDNSTGFSALFSGGRQIHFQPWSDFGLIGMRASYFWCKDDSGNSNAASKNYRAYFSISNSYANTTLESRYSGSSLTFISSGFYVRLVKD
jgi:uncharacterized protein (TIGR02145 family)